MDPSEGLPKSEGGGDSPHITVTPSSPSHSTAEALTLSSTTRDGGKTARRKSAKAHKRNRSANSDLVEEISDSPKPLSRDSSETDRVGQSDKTKITGTTRSTNRDSEGRREKSRRQKSDERKDRDSRELDQPAAALSSSKTDVPSLALPKNSVGTEPKTGSPNSVLVSARGDKVLTIYLMNGQLHSTAVTPTKTLRQVITRMAVSRNDLNLQTCRAVDMDGNELNLDKKLTDLGVSEVRIELIAKSPSVDDADLDLDIELMNKLQSIDYANIETVDEFMQGGLLMTGDSLDLAVPEEEDNAESFTRRKLKEIVAKMKDKDDGITVKTRKLRLRAFDKCFIASEAVKWISENLSLSKPEAVAVGRGLEREGLIYHVTLSYNFDDSSSLFFRFSEDEEGGLASAALASPDDAASGIALPVVPIAFGKKITKMFDSDIALPRYHQQFWTVSHDVKRKDHKETAKRKSLKSSMLLHALTSYVPNVVLRRYIKNPEDMKAPEIETYPACLLFADISGFTSLTERLAMLGSRGVEQLTVHLNEYFGQMINLIFNHGGDIVKFAGDALIAIWPTTAEAGLAYSCMLACQCALTMQEHLHNHDADGVPLTLHIGIGAGEINGLHVGGVADRLEFLIAGDPLDQASHCEAAAKSGEVYISKQAAIRITEMIELSVDRTDKKRQDKKKKEKIKPDPNDGFANYRLERIADAVPLPISVHLPNFSGMKKCISPYVQPAVLGHIKSGSPDHFLAELRTVSVIFVNLDMPYSPAKLDVLQTAVKTMQTAIYNTEGTLRQFIIDDKGSVLIAAFGLPPLSHEDDPARALRASLYIQKQLKELGIANSIGVTTGKAFCGAVGSEERREYAMVGDIVNLSARLMAKAGGSILCDQPTFMASKSRFSFKTLPPVTVKGKSMAIEVYSPLRETQYDSHTIRRPKEFGSLGRAAALKNKKINLSSLRLGEEKIVGRQTELKQIVEELDKIVQPPTEMASSGDSKQNDSKVIIIEGEAGIGKTRFVQEVYNMALRRKIKSLVGSTYSIEANTTYFAWKEIFAGIFDIDRSQDPGGSRGAPQDRTEKVLEKLTETAPEFIDLAPLLSAVLPIDLPDNDKTAQISGQLRAEKLQAILMKMILASDIRLIVLENAHWLDSASWQLAYAATQELKHVAIILAMRPDVKPMEFVKIQQLPGFLQIKLSGLHAEDVEELVKNRLEAHSVPKEVVQLVYEKGAGNPMLIGEFIDALKHSGRIDVTPTGECRVNRAMNKQLSTLGIPDTLRGLITGKVDRLSQSQQMILKVASVIGRVFEIDILQQILQSLSGTSLDPDTIMNDVILLEAADMIQLKTEEPLSYTFKQNMTQEVVYELMLHAQRRVLHEKVAEWYETHENDQGGEAFNLLAHHWKEAENVEKAMSYYSKSGERALANSANREAVTFFTEAIELQHKRQQQIGDGGKQSRQSSLLQHLCWQRQLGQATYNLGLLEKASHHLDTALLLIGEPVKPSDASHLLGKLKLKSPRAAPHLDPKLFKLSSQSSPTSSSATESPNSARKSSKKSSTLINLLVQNREHILILLTLGKVHYYACNKDLVTYCNLVALKKAEEYGISKELCEAYGNAIMTAGMHNKRDYAEALIGSGVALAQQFGKVDTDPYMNVLHAAGVYYTGIGMWKRAEEALTKCVKIAEEVGNPRRLEEAYGVISTSQYLQGKIRDSFATNELAVESARRRGDLQSQVLSLLAQARNQIALGQIDKALGSLLQIEAFAAKSDGYKLDVASEINYHALMAMVYVSKKDFELAIPTADTAAALIEKTEPTAYFTFIGYMTVPVVLTLGLYESMKPNPSFKLRFPKERLIQRIQAALNSLAKFAKFFPFAEPRLMLWQGLFEQISTGKLDKSQKLWRESLKAAERLEMMYDQATAMYKLGKTTDVKDSRDVVQEKLKFHDKAIDIFDQIGAVYTELQLE